MFVNISAKTEYACLAAIELAANHGSQQPMRVRSIAERHGIPPRFLVQILLQLKAAGLVTSVRGASGGYALAEEPDTITLGQVMRLVEGEKSGVAPGLDATSPAARVLHTTWTEVAAVQDEMLDGITLADLVRRAGGHDELMYYI